MIPAFLDMIRRNGSLFADKTRHLVFVNAIFEIKENYSLPMDKKELVELLEKKVVIPFHKSICPACHTIPDAKRWMEKLDGRRQMFPLSKATHSW